MNPSPATKEKRKRSRMACVTCRSRKVRCSVDEGLPCHNCRTDGIQCCIPEHRAKRPKRSHISISEDGASPNTQAFSDGLVISHHIDEEPEQSPSPGEIGQFHTSDESPSFIISGAKLSELPPTPAPSVAAENRSCPRSWTVSALGCPMLSRPPTRDLPDSVCNRESRNSHGQTHVSLNASLESNIGQSQMPIPCYRDISDIDFAEGGDLEQGQSQFQAFKEAPQINAEGDNAAFQNLLNLANNLAKLAYSLSLLHKPCHLSHTRCECQERTTQTLHTSSCDHAKCSIQQLQKPICDVPDLDSCLISPVDISKSNSGILDDDEELRLENLLTTSWPAADFGQDLGYQ